MSQATLQCGSGDCNCLLSQLNFTQVLGFQHDMARVFNPNFTCKICSQYPSQHPPSGQLTTLDELRNRLSHPPSHSALTLPAPRSPVVQRLNRLGASFENGVKALKYSDIPNKLLYRLLRAYSDLHSTPNTYYTAFQSVVQSSGYGKSSVSVHLLRHYLPGIYFNCRSSSVDGYPESNVKLHSILKQYSGIDGRLAFMILQILVLEEFMKFAGEKFTSDSNLPTFLENWYHYSSGFSNLDLQINLATAAWNEASKADKANIDHEIDQALDKRKSLWRKCHDLPVMTAVKTRLKNHFEELFGDSEHSRCAEIKTALQRLCFLYVFDEAGSVHKPVPDRSFPDNSKEYVIQQLEVSYEIDSESKAWAENLVKSGSDTESNPREPWVEGFMILGSDTTNQLAAFILKAPSSSSRINLSNSQMFEPFFQFQTLTHETPQASRPPSAVSSPALASTAAAAPSTEISPSRSLLPRPIGLSFTLNHSLESELLAPEVEKIPSTLLRWPAIMAWPRLFAVGRPLWFSVLAVKSSAFGMRKFALEKLTNYHTLDPFCLELVSLKDLNGRVVPTLFYALLNQLIPLTVYPPQIKQQDLMSTHMATACRIDVAKDQISLIRPPEPVLAEAALAALSDPNTALFDNALLCLRRGLQLSPGVNTGQLGELIGSLLLLRAVATAYRKSRHSTELKFPSEISSPNLSLISRSSSELIFEFAREITENELKEDAPTIMAHCTVKEWLLEVTGLPASNFFPSQPELLNSPTLGAVLNFRQFIRISSDQPITLDLLLELWINATAILTPPGFKGVDAIIPALLKSPENKLSSDLIIPIPVQFKNHRETPSSWKYQSRDGLAPSAYLNEADCIKLRMNETQPLSLYLSLRECAPVNGPIFYSTYTIQETERIRSQQGVSLPKFTQHCFSLLGQNFSHLLIGPTSFDGVSNLQIVRDILSCDTDDNPNNTWEKSPASLATFIYGKVPGPVTAPVP